MNRTRHLKTTTSFAAAILALLSLPSGTMAGDLIDTEERVLEIDEIAMLKAHAVDADISVRAHDSATARLLIHRKVRKLSDEDAAMAMEALKTTFEIKGDTLILESDLPENAREWKKETGYKRLSFDLRYELWIPASIAVSMKAVDGDLMVENRSGNCTLSSVDGDILTRGTTSDVTANSVDGDIQIQGATGVVRANTVDGDIIAIGGNQIQANTTDGDIFAQFTDQPSVKCKLNSIDGDIQVTLPADAAFSIKAVSQDGVIDCDFPITSASGRKGQLNGDINGGGESLVLNSLDGDITIAMGTAKL